MVVFTKIPSESVARLFPRGKIRDFQHPESCETDFGNVLFARKFHCRKIQTSENQGVNELIFRKSEAFSFSSPHRPTLFWQLPLPFRAEYVGDL